MSKKLTYGFLLVLAGLTFAGVLAGCRDTSQAVEPSASETAEAEDGKESGKLFEYEEAQLDNGLDIITLEDFSTPIVAVKVWYKVGSKDEDPQRQGFAHMFEHMMFKGTEYVSPRDHFDLIQKVGGTTNAYTSFDVTVYEETLPANQLELALWLEAERMAFLNINQEHVDTERQVVEEELRMGENKPYGNVFKKQFAGVFEQTPYSWTPIGKIGHLRASSVQEMRDFWKKYYIPNNATLVIAGAVKHEEARKLAEQYFGWIPKYEDPKPAEYEKPEQDEPKVVVIDDENAPAARLDILWRTVPIGDDDEVVLDLLGEILGGGKSSRLYRELVAEKQLAVSASASTYNLEFDGVFFTRTMQAPEADAEQIRQIIRKHIDRVAEEGVSAEELEKAKNQLLKYLVTTSLTVESKAEMLGSAAVRRGDVSKVNTILEDVKAVTAEDIQRAAGEYLAEEKANVFIIEKNAKGAAANKDDESGGVTAPREETAPAPGRPGTERPEDWPMEAPVADAKAFEFEPSYTSETLDNGLQVIVVQNHEVPFVTARLGMLAGAWTEDKPGTASMAMQMLTKGTVEHSEAELAEILETNAISLAGSANLDTSSIDFSCVAEKVELATELMAEVTKQPTFPAEEFDKLKKQVLTGLQIKSQNPDYLANRELKRRLFGEHPYSRNVTGEIGDVGGLAVGDLQRWWDTVPRPERAVLIFAGDIKPGEAMELAKKNFGEWQNENAVKTDPKDLPEIPGAEATHVYLIDRPGSAQSEIRIGQLGITRHEQPEYFVSRIVTNYFGGQFGSRLNHTIRVEKGLTYGAYGYWSANAMAGTFKMDTFTKTASTVETVKTMFNEVDRLENKPPTIKELVNSQTYITGSFARQRETPQAVAEDLWLIHSQNLNDNYLDKFLEQVTATTAEDCIEFANESLDPEKMVVVVAGDAEALKAELEKIAPVTVIEAD
ncbi:Protease 3 precursor [Anaerohalosphaera lusitana]|uniref:Protease 3 n=1 Tax=Anaerohalosphaera lusitana TaxID=1936003 RepID=A0A1U9NR92_9BACT|nr:pitrilysin family protein [Anaerohalosphaera lusitana]AQT70238.1 Protease 3 precursor [Anaerohalosphaera lusitana]